MLRRQKIYTETNFSVSALDITKDCSQFRVVPKITTTKCETFPICYREGIILPSCEFSLKNFVHTESNLLINCSDVKPFFNNFVPFYQLTKPSVLPCVLLNVPKPPIDPSGTSIIVGNNTHYSKKGYASIYCRNSMNKKCRPILDLNEIIPVAEDMLPHYFNFNNRRAQFASEGDVMILDPLLLEAMPRNRVKTALTDPEQNKIARITITYILAFFALVLTTYFIIYLA